MRKADLYYGLGRVLVLSIKKAKGVQETKKVSDILKQAMAQFEKAIATLQKAESYDKERTDVYNLMGYCYFKSKEHEKAIECFRKVLQLDPTSAIDYANIASNYRDMGDKEKAIRYYRFALELDPTIDFARENLEKLE